MSKKFQKIFNKEKNLLSLIEQNKFKDTDLSIFSSDIQKICSEQEDIKREYIRFEIEKGEFSFSANSIVGVYLHSENDKVKEVKERVIFVNHSSNNQMLQLILNTLNGSIAFNNLSKVFNSELIKTKTNGKH